MTLKSTKRGVLLLTAVLAVFCFTGCKDVGEPQIIGEKQESDTYGQNEAANISAEATVREQVQAPEHYQTEIAGDGIVLIADAPVTVPDAATAVLGASRSVSFTEEEYSLVKKVMTDAIKIQWQDEQSKLIQILYPEGTEEPQEAIGTRTQLEGVNDSGDLYGSVYQTFEEMTPLYDTWIWVEKISTDGRHTTKSPDIIEVDEGMDGQPTGERTELEAKAEKLLQDTGFKDYQMYQRRWRTSYYQLGDKSWSESEYWMTFTPTAGGITCANPIVSLLGVFSIELKGPYIDICYSEDGTLNLFKIVGKEDIQEENTTETFLLPFEAVHQLSEQYFRDSFVTTSAQRRVMLENIAGAGYTTPGPRITIKNVKLEYIFVMPDDDTKVELELIPVWNFYGSVENFLPSAETVASIAGYRIRDQEGMILSIRADDGRILVD